jgi:hypothetical protein
MLVAELQGMGPASNDVWSCDPARSQCILAIRTLPGPRKRFVRAVTGGRSLLRTIVQAADVT